LPKGENDPTVEGGLAAAKPLVRLAVLFGGPLMNLLIGAILFSMVFLRTGVPDTSRVLITSTNAGSPAEAAGLQAGDIILTINEKPVSDTKQLQEIVAQNLGKEITMTVERKNEVLEFNATPRLNPPPDQGSLGIFMGNPVITDVNIFQAMPVAFKQMVTMSKELLIMPVRLIQGAIPSSQARLVSPIGIYTIFSRVRDVEAEQTQKDPSLANLNTIWFLGTLSIALGVTNLLPLPALDGGRIIFVLPELLFKKRIKPQYENFVHFIGFSALLLLMFILAINDIINPIVIP
ncbi:MAG: site-2 protease family protein, partial [Anaerolineaceae bacterium]|nr:site-2 protease family protein [Anaerolineaceae bacterium]